jgi:fructoselysine-6-P-deglycase FrlB-like protein
MIQNDQAQTAMAREIREIPLTTERLLAAHDLVATVAHRIRHANPRVVVISGRGSSGNAGTFLRYLFEARGGFTCFDVRFLSRDNVQTIDRYAECRFHRHIAIRP